MIESRLDHAALPRMKLALAEKQPVPKQLSGARKGAALRKVLMVGHQYVTDKIRVIEQENIPATELHIRDIAKLASHAFKVCERIFAESQKSAAGKSLFRAGWKAKHKSVGRCAFVKPAHDIEKEQGQLRLARGIVNRPGTVS
jgi:hypothetical protein